MSQDRATSDKVARISVVTKLERCMLVAMVLFVTSFRVGLTQIL